MPNELQHVALLRAAQSEALAPVRRRRAQGLAPPPRDQARALAELLQPDAVALLAADAPRLVLAGHPRGGSAATRAEPMVLRPKELLLALAAAAAEAAGRDVLRANPHFLKTSCGDGRLAVAHFAPLELACPLPRARNALVLDGEDLLALAEERRAEAEAGLHRRRVALMDAVLGLAPPGLETAHLLGRPMHPLPVSALLDHAGALDATGAGRPPGPVQWLPCDLETGHYNYLELKRRPRLGTSHARVLLDPALRGGAGAVLAFATPGSLPEIAPALRAFAALRGTESEAGPGFFLLFFGSPEEFATALAARPDALFFGDNFRCPAIRILFAPFAAADVLGAIRAARVVIDSCHGGVLEALARCLGVPRRIILGPGGSLDAETGIGAPLRGIGWAGLLEPAALAARRQKASRAGERLLADLLEAML